MPSTVSEMCFFVGLREGQLMEGQMGLEYFFSIKLLSLQLLIILKFVENIKFHLKEHIMQIESTQPTVANFVQKSFEIIANEQNNNSIEWLPSGREFIIKDTELFESVILPHYFRHRNINSFIRQLNMYGFHKSRKEPTKNIFSHPNFLKGRPDILINVKRKLKEDKNEQNMLPNSMGPKKQKGQTSETHFQKNQNFEPILSREVLKSRQNIEHNFQKRQKQLQKTAIKHEPLVSLCSMEMMDQLQQPCRSNDWPLKCLFEKSHIMDLNPDLYNLKHENLTSLNHIEDHDFDYQQQVNQHQNNNDNDQEIERERKKLNNRMAGYNILNTINFMSEFQL